MTRLLSSRRKAAWIAPLVGALVIAGIVAVPAVSNAAPDLPSITAKELITKVASTKPGPMSGTVKVTTDLGIPDLSALGLENSASADPMSLLMGTTTLRVWADPQVGARADIQGKMSEYVVVANTTDFWTYSSADETAVHAVISADAKEKASQKPTETMPTPEAIADKALEAVDSSTKVTVTTPVTIAGRDSYELVLEPKDAGSLVSSVRIAVDAQTWRVLRTQVWSVENTADPAVNVGFTSVSYDTPNADHFTFTPPKGTEITEVPLDKLASKEEPTQESKDAMKKELSAVKPTVTKTGQGWATIVEVKNTDALAALVGGSMMEESPEADMQGPSRSGLTGSDMSGILDSLGTDVDGGTAYHTTLFSMLVTDDGRIYVGAVPTASLLNAAKK